MSRIWGNGESSLSKVRTCSYQSPEPLFTLLARFRISPWIVPKPDKQREKQLDRKSHKIRELVIKTYLTIAVLVVASSALAYRLGAAKNAVST
jgi:hypothetical protein